MNEEQFEFLLAHLQDAAILAEQRGLKIMHLACATAAGELRNLDNKLKCLQRHWNEFGAENGLNELFERCTRRSA